MDTILYSSTNAGAILTVAKQGPAGAGVTVVGTGFVHVTAGAIDGAARAVNLGPGSADISGSLPLANFDHTGSSYNILQMNSTGSLPVWGPLQLGQGNAVTGALPVANIAPAGTNGWVLTTTAGAAVWAAPAAGGITQLTSDVTAGPGSGSVAATVVAAQAGLLAFTATTGTIAWATGATAPGLSQATAGSGVTPVGMVLAPQAPNVGSTGTAPGTPGSLFVNLAAAVSTGVEGALVVKRATQPYAYLGPWALNTAYSALTMGPNITPSGSSIANANYTILVSSGATTFGSPNTFDWYGAGTHLSMWNGGTGEIQFGFNVAIGTTTGGAYGGGTGGVLSIPKAGTNPSSSATGAVIYADSSTGAVCLYPAGVTAAALSMSSAALVVAPTATAVTAATGAFSVIAAQNATGTGATVGGNLNLWSGGGATGGTVNIGVNLTPYLAVTNAGANALTNLGVAGLGSVGGGLGVLGLTNAGTQPTPASVSGGVALAANGGSFSIYDATATIYNFGGGNYNVNGNYSMTSTGVSSGNGGSATFAGGNTSANSAVGGPATLKGGNGTGTTATGGAATLESGTGTSNNGALNLSSGVGTVYSAVGIYSSGNNPGAWAWNGPSVTNTQLVAGTGKATLSAGTVYTFLPVTINGKAMQIVCCF